MPQLALVHIVAISGVALAVAYVVYGRILVRLLQLDDRRPTPAVEMKDDVDYVPTERKFLLGQHFSAIAAAGPIVGPILAGVAFGWLPALLWILIGSIFIGGVHDITALVASIRHRARSIPEVVREHMSGRAYLLFLAFVWLCLVYIIVAFTDVTASSFIGVLKLDEATAETSAVVAASSSAPIPEKSAETAVTPAAPSIVVSGPGIASSSLMYLLLPIGMGLLLRYRKLSVGVATAVFLPLVAFAIWYGQKIPLDVQSWFGLSDVGVRRFWNAALLVYCCIASVLPAWLLLQPRGHLGGYFLYAALIAGAVGVTIGGTPVRYPAFIGWESAAQGPLFPFLFITIACSACSGFHSIIASGTTSKQLRVESDALPIGYGAMLLEAMVGVVSLCCVMMLAPGVPLLAKEPNFLYAGGIAAFLKVVGVPMVIGIAFGLMAFTTFVYDTLDVCTRLGRFILQELFGWTGAAGRWTATVITVLAPLPFLMWIPTDAAGKIVPVWRTFWRLFGASNQLLAALTLLGVTVWLWRTRRAMWVWFVTGIPTAWMYLNSMWALGATIRGRSGSSSEFFRDAVPSVALVLFTLGALLLIEALIVVARSLPPRPPQPALQPA